MARSVEGIYKNGKIELLEKPPTDAETRVIVTFPGPPGPVDLRAVGLSEDEAASLRTRLGTFAADWERPEMEVYDAL
jgi:hypothetical protein